MTTQRVVLSLTRSIAIPVSAFALCAGLVLAGPAHASAANLLPAPTGYVNDFAKVLSVGAKNNLESELSQFNASTSNEVAVVTVSSMNGDYIEHYAATLFQQWGIGTKKNDNGVLLLLAIGDHKLRIEVGYGLEGALPDSTAASIIADMTPLLKQNNYDGAVTLGVQEIEQATKGEYVGTGATTNTNSTNKSFQTIYWVIIAGIFSLQWLMSILARSKSYWAGGVVGGVAGVALATFFGWWLLLGLGVTALLFLIGLLLDLVVSRTYATSKSLGTRSPWWAGGNMGSSGGGGFGGFGGGSSGGGGASGGW